MSIDAWYAITVIGDVNVWLAASLGLVALYVILRGTFWRGRNPKSKQVFKQFVVLLIISVWVTSGIVFAMKQGLQVPRPCQPCEDLGALRPPGCNIYCPTESFSFPSGHSAVAFASFVSLLLIYRRKPLYLLLLVPLLVGLSRIVLGVHTVEDTVAGGAIGIIVAVAAYKIELHKIRL